jgi:hypothetical protein
MASEKPLNLMSLEFGLCFSNLDAMHDKFLLVGQPGALLSNRLFKMMLDGVRLILDKDLVPKKI